MDILQKYNYLLKPIVGIIILYFSSSDMLRNIINLTTIVFLIIESYISFQLSGKPTTILKLWIMFGLILGFDYVSYIIFGRVIFPTLTNSLRVIFLLWLTYDPINISLSYDYLEPYLKIVTEYYNSILLHISKTT